MASLLEVLSDKELKGLVTKANLRIQWINNLYISFIFMAKEKVGVENISAEDIADRDLKLILALLWNLILHYQLKSSSMPSTEGGSQGI